MQRRDLGKLSVTDVYTLDLDDVTTSFGLPSPMNLVSPNIALKGSPAGKPAAGGAALAAGRCSPVATVAGKEAEENEPLGALPQFGGRRIGTRRPDARRQSLAIGAVFAGLSAGMGLLGETELAVGDEEIQVPLAKSGKLLGGTANHSSLFVDPDTGDLLDAELPSPLIDGGGTGQRDAGNSSGSADMQPAQCGSPLMVSQQRGTASSRRTPAMRASTVFGDLDRACKGLGLDDFDSGDFQLQESNKVKELAFLFKAGMGCAASSPRSSIAMQCSIDGGNAATAAAATTAAQLGSSSPGSSADGGLVSIQQRLQQFQVGSSAAAVPARGQQQQEAQKLEVGKMQQQSTAEPPAAKRAEAGPGGGSMRTAAQPASGSGRMAAQPTAARSTGALSAIYAVGSKPSVPPARASRLRPPTTSSGYFSSAATDGRQAAGPTATALRPGSSGRPSSHPASGSSIKRAGAVAASSSCTPAPARTTKAAAELQPAVGHGVPPAPTAKQPVVSWLTAQQSSSRIPTPSKPGSSRLHLAGSGTTAGAAAQAEGHSSRLAPSAEGQPIPLSSIKVPALRQVSPSFPASSSSGTSLTPNSARLRFLEQNPELAFGDGTKLADRPAKQDAAPKKLTAKERHLKEWQDHL